MENLIYEGIVFDEYTQDDGGIWAEICEKFAQKNTSTKIANNIDDGGTACGCCSVKGCNNNGSDPNKKHYYIDFRRKK